MMNKKLLIFFIQFFILFSSITAESIKIVSFNLNGSDSNHRLESNEQWAKDIVTIFNQSEADIILLQEVYLPLETRIDTPYFKKARSNNVLDYFTNRLSGYKGIWKYYSSSNYMLRKNIKINEEEYLSGNNTQNNAVLYNSSKFRGYDKYKELKFDDFSGKYRFDKNSLEVIEFKQIDTDESFIIMNVHLPSNNKEHQDRDLKTLKQLFNSYKARYPVIIGGDLNISRKDLTPSHFEYVDGTIGYGGWYNDSHFGLLTTISGNGKTYISFASDFDHFIYDNKIQLVTKMERIGIHTKDENLTTVKIANHTFDNSKELKNRISDHYPIIIEFELPAK